MCTNEAGEDGSLKEKAVFGLTLLFWFPFMFGCGGVPLTAFGLSFYKEAEDTFELQTCTVLETETMENPAVWNKKWHTWKVSTSGGRNLTIHESWIFNAKSWMTPTGLLDDQFECHVHESGRTLWTIEKGKD